MSGRKIAFAFTAAVAALGMASPAISAGSAKQKLTPEQSLEKRLKGWVAGEPVDCIYLPMVRNTTIYDKTAILYDSGSTIYVNRPKSGASFLDDDDVMITTPTGSQLCSIDIVRLQDRTSGMFGGTVGLGKFVPYRKTDTTTHQHQH